MRADWVCFGLGFGLVSFGAVRSLRTSNVKLLDDVDRSPMTRVLGCATVTALITFATAAFGAALLVVLGWVFGRDLTRARTIAFALAATLPLITLAQGLARLFHATAPPPSAPVGERLRARWITYLVLLSPGLLNIPARLVAGRLPASELGARYIANVEAIGLLGLLAGLPLVAWITLVDSRRPCLNAPRGADDSFNPP